MIGDTLLRDVPLSVLDFETTGLSAATGCRVVEVGVVRVVAGHTPSIVFDTLIDPRGPVLCSSVHGIEDQDVLGAPTFDEILGDLVSALQGSIVGAFNASFDMSFLSAEIRAARLGDLRLPPHLCLMWLRPLVGLSNRCSLDVACVQHGLKAGTHRAVEDALACAHMWEHYVDAAEKRGIKTVSQLSAAGTHKYLKTLGSSPYTDTDLGEIGRMRSSTALKPRFGKVSSPLAEAQKPKYEDIPERDRVRVYWRALVDALVDGQIQNEEFKELVSVRKLLRLTEEEIRAVHAQIFSDRLREFSEDNAITLRETDRIADLHAMLRQLGWAPGS